MKFIHRHIIDSMKSSERERDEVVVVYNIVNAYEIYYSDGTFNRT